MKPDLTEVQKNSFIKKFNELIVKNIELKEYKIEGWVNEFPIINPNPFKYLSEKNAEEYVILLNKILSRTI